MDPSSSNSLVAQGLAARKAAKRLALSSGHQRRRSLLALADAIGAHREQILDANERDLEECGSTMPRSQVDRLRLDAGRLDAMVSSIRVISEQPDVVGVVESGWRLPNGVEVERVRVPLGVIGVIYENRPNVTSDSAALCVMSGNAVLLRGSSSAMNSNRAIVDAMRAGLAATDLPQDSVLLVEDCSHEGVREFMELEGVLDCLIPRGGKSLLAAVREYSRVPTIFDGEGNCHIYVDARADLTMALQIVGNAKLQRPGVCNAVETILVHSAVAAEFLSRLDPLFAAVVIRGDQRVQDAIPRAEPASEQDWETEYLDYKVAIRVIESVDHAIDHIERYSSGHSEAVVTEDLAVARRFVEEVDAAAVLVNASPRFIDGGELGFGAEIGISTQKLHARGPMGMRELTTLKYVVHGYGQIRG
jgi:glutamate-5-semialdehyde dehydrogenase